MLPYTACPDNPPPAHDLRVARFLAQQDPLYELAQLPVTSVQYDHPDPYRPAEIEALQGYTATHPFTTLRRRAMNLLAFYWGGRRGEQSRADAGDLDLDALVLDMQLPGKRGKKRRVPLPSLLASPKRAFVPYLNEKSRLFPSQRALWVGLDGQRLTPDVLSRETWHMSQELGFAVSFNRWRRSWQTTLRRCGVRKEIAKYIQGHTWGRDSTDHYWTPDVEDVRAELVACKVPGFIRSRKDAPLRVRAPLPVPFARHIVDDGETESALII